jgi:hypothetical protein
MCMSRLRTLGLLAIGLLVLGPGCQQEKRSPRKQSTAGDTALAPGEARVTLQLLDLP